MTERAWVSSALVAIALAAAGCGGSGSTAASQTAASAATTSSQPVSSGKEKAKASSPIKPTSRPPMVIKAEAICAQLSIQLTLAHANSSSAQEIVRHVPQRAAAEQSAVAELAKLKPPASLATAWREILAYRRTLADELIQLVQAAKRNDSAAIRALGASKARVHAQLLVAAQRAKIPYCGQTG